MKQKRFAKVDDDAHRMEQSARLRTDLNSLDRAARGNESWANISLHSFCSDELTERSPALRDDPQNNLCLILLDDESSMAPV